MNRSGWPAITADQMREVDRVMVEDLGISLEQMMEMAGRNLADLAMEMLHRERPRAEDYRVAVVCGTGNNGGGGMVAARILFNRGVTAAAVLAGDRSRLKPVPEKRWKTLELLPLDTVLADRGIPDNLLQESDLIVDAVLGYGLTGNPGGFQAEVIEGIVESGNGAILSLDVPSGLDCTSGQAPGICVSAAATMTLALPKTGLVKSSSRGYVGDLYAADIGVPPQVYANLGLGSLQLFTEETIRLVRPG